MMPAEMFECDVGACRMADPLAERRRSGFETLTQGANRLSLAVFAAPYPSVEPWLAPSVQS